MLKLETFKKFCGFWGGEGNKDSRGLPRSLIVADYIRQASECFNIVNLEEEKSMDTKNRYG